MADDVLPELTEKQRTALLFIAGHQRRNGTMPTTRAIAAALGQKRVDPAPVILPLQKKGYLEILKGTSRRTGRNLKLTPKAEAWFVLHPPAETEIEELLARARKNEEARKAAGRPPEQMALL